MHPRSHGDPHGHARGLGPPLADHDGVASDQDGVGVVDVGGGVDEEGDPLAVGGPRVVGCDGALTNRLREPSRVRIWLGS